MPWSLPRLVAICSLVIIVIGLVGGPALARGGGDHDRFRELIRALIAKLERAFDFDSYVWSELNPAAPWSPRAGLESVELDGRLLVMGGRTPLGPPAPPFASIIQRDVWMSEDDGESWVSLGEAPWPERAFFEAVVKDGYVYVMGGQSFDLVCPGPPGCEPDVAFPVSNFYNDVWRSPDGVSWELMTDDAGWAGRAGLSAAVLNGWIYVFAGAQGDDEAIGGSGREFYRDVWRSRDGRRWRRMKRRAPWQGRGGAATVVKNGRIFMIGGEEGFLLPALGDVWTTRNGRHWRRLSAEGISPRSGHKCGVLWDQIFCFGGFSLLGNPMDVQRSSNGVRWTPLEAPAAPPWGAAEPLDIKYDFDIVVRNRGFDREILTFGGDREAFELPPGGPPGAPPFPAEDGGPPPFGEGEEPPFDLRVDNDVWRFGPPGH